MKLLTNKLWWSAALTRCLKTCAQTAIATIGTGALISEVDWVMVVSSSAVAGLLSLLTSIAGLPEVNTDEIDEFESPDGKYL